MGVSERGWTARQEVWVPWICSVGELYTPDRQKLFPDGSKGETLPWTFRDCWGIDVTHTCSLSLTHIHPWERRAEGFWRSMEALRESFLHLTFQMSTYKRATLDEEDLVDSTGDEIYPSSDMQVNAKKTTMLLLEMYRPWLTCIMQTHFWFCHYRNIVSH